MQEHLREEERSNRLAEARKTVAEMYRKRKGKQQEREAFWKEYNEQLAKGNSNRNIGAHHRSGGSVVRCWVPWGGGNKP